MLSIHVYIYIYIYIILLLIIICYSYTNYNEQFFFFLLLLWYVSRAAQAFLSGLEAAGAVERSTLVVPRLFFCLLKYIFIYSFIFICVCIHAMCMHVCVYIYIYIYKYTCCMYVCVDLGMHVLLFFSYAALWHILLQQHVFIKQVSVCVVSIVFIDTHHNLIHLKPPLNRSNIL